MLCSRRNEQRNTSLVFSFINIFVRSISVSGHWRRFPYLLCSELTIHDFPTITIIELCLAFLDRTFLSVSVGLLVSAEKLLKLKL